MDGWWKEEWKEGGKEKEKAERAGKKEKGKRKEGWIFCWWVLCLFRGLPRITSVKGRGFSSVWLFAEGFPLNPDLNGMCKVLLWVLGARRAGITLYLFPAAPVLYASSIKAWSFDFTSERFAGEAGKFTIEEIISVQSLEFLLLWFMW